MSVMYIVLPIALLLAAAGVWAFIWAVRNGQLDDLQTPALRMLLDDDPPAARSGSAAQEAENHAEKKQAEDPSQGGAAPSSAGKRARTQQS